LILLLNICKTEKHEYVYVISVNDYDETIRKIEEEHSKCNVTTKKIEKIGNYLVVQILTVGPHYNDTEGKYVVGKNGMVHFHQDKTICRRSARYKAGMCGWALDRADQKLDFYCCKSSLYNGSGVNVYIVDTGINFHRSFNPPNPIFGYDYYGQDGADARECTGHGTHVAGIVASTIYGVAPGVSLYNVKVLDCKGEGTVASVISGLIWLLQYSVPPCVINMSFGVKIENDDDYNPEEIFKELLEDLGQICTLVASVGNGGINHCTTPSTLTHYSVGATQENDERAPFSNYGKCVNAWAPGNNIISCLGSKDDAILKSGTSMAAPMITGAIALALERGEDVMIVPDSGIKYIEANLSTLYWLLPALNNNNNQISFASINSIKIIYLLIINMIIVLGFYD
jgi:subtilisin family serine protease